MNTKKAKELAKNRIEVMEKFTDEFLKEWNGEI